jgi:hypothetical protein
MFKGLEHTAIASPDPQKLAQWYVDHLEFHINFEYDGNYFVKAANGSMLEIIPSEGEANSQKIRESGISPLLWTILMRRTNVCKARTSISSEILTKTRGTGSFFLPIVTVTSCT